MTALRSPPSMGSTRRTGSSSSTQLRHRLLRFQPRPAGVLGPGSGSRQAGDQLGDRPARARGRCGVPRRKADESNPAACDGAEREHLSARARDRTKAGEGSGAARQSEVQTETACPLHSELRPVPAQARIFQFNSGSGSTSRSITSLPTSSSGRSQHGLRHLAARGDNQHSFRPLVCATSALHFRACKVQLEVCSPSVVGVNEGSRESGKGCDAEGEARDIADVVIAGVKLGMAIPA